MPLEGPRNPLRVERLQVGDIASMSFGVVHMKKLSSTSKLFVACWTLKMTGHVKPGCLGAILLTCGGT